MRTRRSTIMMTTKGGLAMLVAFATAGRTLLVVEALSFGTFKTATDGSRLQVPTTRPPTQSGGSAPMDVGLAPAESSGREEEHLVEPDSCRFAEAMKSGSRFEEAVLSDKDLAAPVEDKYWAERDHPDWAEQYWADPRIHGFGNKGSLGAVFHAFVAPMFTKILDVFAYDGKDVRLEACRKIARTRNKLGFKRISRAVDLGCGTGYTARSAARTFFSRCSKGVKNEVGVVALDTSDEMLKVAKDITFMCDDGTVNAVEFRRANAEATGLPKADFDLVMAAFVMHEVPRAARHRILEEGFRLLKPGGTFAVLDIHPRYEPSRFMVPGEPYLRGYLDHFEADVRDFVYRHTDRLVTAHRDVIVPGRLVLWHVNLKQDSPENPYFTVKA